MAGVDDAQHDQEFYQPEFAFGDSEGDDVSLPADPDEDAFPPGALTQLELGFDVEAPSEERVESTQDEADSTDFGDVDGGKSLDEA